MEEKLKQRFAIFLKPIKELTANWDVDISTELQVYLDELTSLAPTQDENHPNAVNFAEAALVIQGSASIYSKKVEYLYSLMYNTLENVSTKPVHPSASSIGTDGTDADAAFSFDDDKFLPLDDIIEESDGIDLVETSANNNSNNGNYASVTLATRTPVALLPSTTEDSEDIHDARLYKSRIHASGALCLDEYSLDLISRTGLKDNRKIQEKLTEKNSSNSINIENELNNQIGNTIYDDGSDNGFQNDDYDDYVKGSSDTVSITGQSETAKTLKEGKNKSDNEIKKIDNTKKDIWELLDPHSIAENSKIIPFRKGRPFTNPRSTQIEPAKVGESRFLNLSINIFEVNRSQKLFNSDFDYLFKRAKLQVLKQNPTKKQTTQKGKVDVIGDIDDSGDFGDFDDDWGNENDSGDEHNYNNDNINEKLDFQDLKTNLPSLNDDGDLNLFGTSNFNSFGLTEEKEVDLLEESTQSYEALCKNRMEMFLRHAGASANEITLHQRVQAWQNRISPVLEKEEHRKKFDIHETANKLVSRVSDQVKLNGKSVSILDVIGDEDQSEVSRNFLSLLLIINQGKVEMSQHCDGLGVCGDDEKVVVSIQLAESSSSSKIDIEKYRAPSHQHQEQSQSQSQSSKSSKSSNKTTKAGKGNNNKNSKVTEVTEQLTPTEKKGKAKKRQRQETNSSSPSSSSSSEIVSFV